jgi:hypothetical protein
MFKHILIPNDAGGLSGTAVEAGLLFGKALKGSKIPVLVRR